MEVVPLPVLYFRSKRDYATGAIVLRDGVVGEQDSRSSSKSRLQCGFIIRCTEREAKHLSFAFFVLPSRFASSENQSCSRANAVLSSDSTIIRCRWIERHSDCTLDTKHTSSCFQYASFRFE
jgi:hypothetical protein